MVEDGFAVESEMITLADKAGFKWLECGITADYDGVDANTEGSFKHGLTVLFRIMRLLRIHKPFTFFGAASLLSYLLAFVVTIYSRWLYPEENLLPLGSMYIVTSLFIFGSFFLFMGVMLKSVNKLSDKIIEIFLKSVRAARRR